MAEDGAEMERIETNSAKIPDDQFDYIMIFKAQDATGDETSCFGLKKKKKTFKVKERGRILRRLREVGLQVSKIRSSDKKEVYARITAPQDRLERQAENMLLQMKLKSEYGGGYAEFKINRKHLFEGCGDERFFTSLQRKFIIQDIIENKKRDGGADINIGREITLGNITSFYPLHDDQTVKVLLTSWASFGAAFRGFLFRQPLDDIRDYFGESVAIYFAWLGHYTKWLFFSSLVGFIIFIIQSSIGSDRGPEIVFAVFLAFWATFFLESWKRANCELAFKWNMLGFEELEKTRPDFQGEEKTGVWSRGVFIELTPEQGGKKQKTPTSPYFSPLKRISRIVAGLPLIFAMIIVVISATIGVLIARIAFQQNPEFAAIGGVGASVINAVAILVLNIVYEKIAVTLTNWENHRTDTSYDDALIAKTFAFQFVNSYISLFYIAFFKRNSNIFGVFQDSCKFEGDCIRELFIQLGIILATNITVGQTKEVGIPYIKSKIKSFLDTKNAAKLTGGSKEDQKQKRKEMKLNKAEKEGNLTPYGGTFGEYNEMVIQYGYVTMFAAAFPLAPLLAFINNIVEIRTDAFKLLTETQRPLYAGAQDIGTWYKILEIIGTFAVLTNCLIVAVTANTIRDEIFGGATALPTDDLPWYKVILAALVLEHIILLAKFIVAEIIPDEPEWVRIALAKQNYFKDQALDDLEDEEEGQQVEEEFKDVEGADSDHYDD